MSEIECPYCNRQDAVSDAWELGDGEHEVECENCHKEFIATGKTTLEFDSTRLECDQGNHEFCEWVSLTSRSFINKDAEPKTVWAKNCKHCRAFQFSEELPLGSPLPDHLKEDSQ